MDLITKVKLTLILMFLLPSVGQANARYLPFHKDINYIFQDLKNFKKHVETQSYEYTLRLCYAYVYYDIGGLDSSFPLDQNLNSKLLNQLIDKVHRDKKLKHSLSAWFDSLKKGAFSSFLNFRGEVYNNLPSQYFSKIKLSKLENLFVSDFHHFLFESEGYTKALLHCIGPDMKRWNHFTNLIRSVSASSSSFVMYSSFFLIPAVIFKGILKGFRVVFKSLNKYSNGYSSSLLKLTAISGVAYLSGKAENYRVELEIIDHLSKNLKVNLLNFSDSIQKDLILHRYHNYSQIIKYVHRWKTFSEKEQILKITELERRIESVEGEYDFIVNTISELEADSKYLNQENLNVLTIYKEIKKIIEVKMNS